MGPKGAFLRDALKTENYKLKTNSNMSIMIDVQANPDGSGPFNSVSIQPSQREKFMGYNIHLFVERRAGSHWEPVQRRVNFSREGENLWKGFYYGRNLNLFAMLGGRLQENPNSPQITPIQPPRGLPSDLSPELVKEVKKSSQGHSHSWLTLEEILEWDWEATYERIYYLSQEEYELCRKENIRPRVWYDRVEESDREVVLTEDEYRRLIEGEGLNENIQYYIRTTWTIKRREGAFDFWRQTIPFLEKISRSEGGGDVRIVFWFD